MIGKELEERQRTLAESLKLKAQTLKEVKIAEACVMLVDLSSSMNGLVEQGNHLTKIEAVKQSIPNLQVTNHHVMYGLVGFGDSASQILPLTTHFSNVIAAQEMMSPSGMTNITAGLREGLKMLTGKTNVDKKRMILLSDGQPNIDTGYIEGCLEQCIEGGIIVDTIAFGADADEQRLRKIATQTGGVFCSAKSSQKLKETYAKLNYNVRYLEHKQTG